MLRRVVALTVVLLTSLAFADNFGLERDANLAKLDSFCLTVDISSSDSALANLKPTIERELQDKALLYDLPLNKDCSFAENPDGYAVNLSFATVSSAYSYSIEMLVFGKNAFSLPSIWRVSGVASLASGVSVQDLKDEAAALFDKFALTWKKQHGAALGTATFGFLPASDYSVGTNPSSLAVADVNGDGRTDVVAANYADDTVSVLYASGSANLKPQRTYDTDRGPVGIALADVNGDGKPDIVTANEKAGTVSVLLQEDGFAKHVDYEVGGSPGNVALADQNQDGRPDIIVTTSADLGSVAVLLNNGDGTFEAARTYPLGQRAVSLAVVDVNGDGFPDVVTGGPFGGIFVMLASSSATLLAPDSYNVGGDSEVDVAVADVDRDGNPDIVTANGTAETVSVLLGRGNGTFQPAKQFPDNYLPTSVAVADLDGDGNPDIVTSDWHSFDGVSVLLGNGDGTFRPATSYRTGTGPWPVAVADLNGDGKMDIVTGNGDANSVSVLLGR